MSTCRRGRVYRRDFVGRYLYVVGEIKSTRCLCYSLSFCELRDEGLSAVVDALLRGCPDITEFG